MQKEQKTETFNDGIVSLHEVLEDGGMKGTPIATTRFGNRIVGEGQFYGAMAAGVKISRRIRIPLWEKISDENADAYFAVIGKERYEIKRAQHYHNTKPPCTDLTLSQNRSRR